MKRIFALCCVLVLAGCGSSNSQQANANTAAQPVNEVATARPQATDVPVLGVSQPYQLGAPKGGWDKITIYLDGKAISVEMCDNKIKKQEVTEVTSAEAIKPIVTAPSKATPGLFLAP